MLRDCCEQILSIHPGGQPSGTTMLVKLLLAWLLMAICVVVHAAGLIAAMIWIKRQNLPFGKRFWSDTLTLIGVAGWALLLHFLQIGAWAVLFWLGGAFPDAQAAFYFSSVTYTTTGYGDLVLPPDWRLVGGAEALTGILMCGLSTGLFFAVFTKVFRTHLNK